MPALDGLKFRAGLGDNTAFVEAPGRNLETARFRAHGNPTSDSEPLPGATPSFYEVMMQIAAIRDLRGYWRLGDGGFGPYADSKPAGPWVNTPMVRVNNTVDMSDISDGALLGDDDGAVRFNSSVGSVTSDYLKATNVWGPGPSNPFETITYTIAGWVKPFSSAEDFDGGIFSMLAWTGVNQGYVLGVQWPERKVFCQNSSNRLLGPILDANEWTFVAAINDNDSARIYVNGELAVTGTPSLFAPSTNIEPKIGLWNHSASDGGSPNKGVLYGEIDEVSVWGEALTEEEIGLLASSGVESITSENFGGSGIIVNDDYKTRVVGYWQFWRKHIAQSPYYKWPDLAWRWQKHPYVVDEDYVGDLPPIYGGIYPAGEVHITEEGPYWKGEYAPGFASSPAGTLLPTPSITEGFVYTTHLKFTWAGNMQNGLFNGLTGDQWYANGGNGRWMAGVQGFNEPLPASDEQHHSNFFVSFKYGYYDPGPGDSQVQIKSFMYPISSVLNPELAYESQGQDGNNGIAGKYTFVMVCDNNTTKVGMIRGHNGGEIEWFGEMTPFVYPTSPTTVGIAVSKFRFAQAYGNVDYGGFLGSSWAHWHGWINEYAISSTPYDTLLGELGHLEPNFGYLHLDHIRVRANA